MRGVAVLLLLAACPRAAAPPAPAGAVVEAPAASPLVAVDWANRTYELTLLEGEGELPYPVVDGVYEDGDPDGGFHERVEVEVLGYGDLTSDGVEEAILRVTYASSDLDAFDTLFVFGAAPGGARVLGRIAGGKAGHGGIAAARVVDGALRLERRHAEDGDGACCPTHHRHERWRWDGRFFVEDEAARRLAPVPAGR
ncbi:MAG: hypothetical protein R2939_22605 [Kofleriaceae bacterium]